MYTYTMAPSRASHLDPQNCTKSNEEYIIILNHIFYLFYDFAYNMHSRDKIDGS